MFPGNPILQACCFLNPCQRYLFALFLGLVSVLAFPTPGKSDDLATRGYEVIRLLRAGGFNVYFRHAETDWSQADTIQSPGDWHSCNPAAVRQLSDQGRANSVLIGQAVRALGVPVGRILASPYCRTMETAELMGLGAVASSEAIINMRIADYFGGRDAVIATARELLSVAPEPGTNTILVAHGNVARAATAVYPDEAEGVMFAPDNEVGFRYVARITPSQWVQLAAMAGLQL